MKRKLILCAFGLMLTTAMTAPGDIARPKPQPSPAEPKHLVNTRLQIVPDTKTYGGARLQLSESAVKELREALRAGTPSQSFTQGVTNSGTNTIVAGVLLFMSISFAGIWLVRSSSPAHSRGQKLVAGALIAIATLGAAAIVTQANAGPPPSYLWRGLQKNLSAGKPTSGSVDIEIVPGGEGVKLIVPVRNSGSADD